MKKDGFITLITTIIVGAVGMLVAAYLLISAVSTGKTSLSDQQSAQAKSAANACVELALAQLQTNTNLVSPVTLNYTIDSVAKSICSYTTTGVSPNYVVTATGTVDVTNANVVRRLQITLNQVGPTLNVSSWQEIP